MPESGLRQRIRQAIHKAYPWALVRARPATAASGPGWPDLDILLNGVYVALEVKTPKGRITDLQALRILDLRKAGGYAWVVRSAQESVRAIDAALYMDVYGVRMATEESVEFDFDALFNGAAPAPEAEGSLDLADLAGTEAIPPKPVEEVKPADEETAPEPAPKGKRKAAVLKSEEPNLVPYLALIEARIDKLDPRLQALEEGIKEILALLTEEPD